MWPEKMKTRTPMLPQKQGLRMCAANGTEIVNHGRKVMKFRGMKWEKGSEMDCGVVEKCEKEVEMNECGKWYMKNKSEKGFMRRV